MATLWYVRRGDRHAGPFTSSELKALAAKKQIQPTDEVCRDGGTEWAQAYRFKGLFAQAITEAPPAKPPSVVTAPPWPVVELGEERKPPAPFEPQSSRIVAADSRATSPAVSPDTKACPFCGETILATAKKCKHCGEMLDPTLRQSGVVHAAPGQSIVINNNVGMAQAQPVQRWSPLVAAFLSFLIPGLGQLYKGQPINGIVWFVAVVVGYAFLIIPGLILHLCCVLGAASGDPFR